MKAYVLWLLLLISGLGWAQSQRYDRIYVVPPPGPITVDGDLADWDLSAALDSAFDEALRPLFSMKVALMADAGALYIGCHFADDTPLLNRHDPEVEPTRGWDGDALQVRLCSDPAAPYPLADSNSDRICHLTLWYYTDKQLPVLQVQYGMDYHGMQVLTGEAAGVAFRADADGRGYTLEARVPWELLNAAEDPPGPDDRIALVFQPLWSDGTGWRQVQTYNEVIRTVGFSFQGAGMWGQAVFLPHGNLAAAERPLTPAQRDEPLSLELPLPDPQATVISSAVFDVQGHLVRLLPVITRKAGQESDKVMVRWDGTDDTGNPLPPGDYRVKFLTHQGIGQRWIASLHNAGDPPWRTDDGRGSWGGDHGPPICAASDDQRVYLGWTVSEAGWSMIAVERALSPNGKPRKLWGQHQVLDIGILVTAMASDGERLFVAQDGKSWGATGGTNTAGVVMWEPATGKPMNFPFGKRILTVSEWPDSLSPPAKPLWELVRDGDAGPRQAGANLQAIAVWGDTIYAALSLEHRVVALNWRTGERVGEYPVPSPVGLAMDGRGRLLVVSERRLLRLNPETGEMAPVVSEGLASPWGVAVDRDGRIYVSDCGNAMQVKVFSAEGVPLRAIGKPGGRPWVGRYEPEGLLMPAALAVDAEGKVWVPEFDSSPKRVSVWSSDGTLLADLQGAGAYAVEGIADERDPRWVNVHRTLYEVNYETGGTRTVATLIRPELTGHQISPAGGEMGRALKTRHVNGRTYLVWPGYHYVTIYLLGDDLVARPVAALGWLKDIIHCGVKKEDLPEAVREEAWANTYQYGFTWTDYNGDNLLQPEEWVVERFLENWGHWGFYWGEWLDEDLTLWSASRGKGLGVYRIPVKQWLPNGAPVYPPPSEQQMLFPLPDTDPVLQVHNVMPGGDCVYVMEQIGGYTQTGQGAKYAAVACYELDGTRRWAYRRCWLGFGLEAPLSRPGDVVGAMKFVGKADLDGGLRLIAVNGYFGQFNLLSGDGLWVTSLCKDNRYGPTADATTVWPENFSGWFFRHPENGKVYLIAGDTDARIWEITGLETIRTGEMAFVLTEEDHRASVAAVSRRQGASAELAPIVVARATGTVTVDGDLSDWDMARGVSVDAGEGRSARAALAYDGAHLLVAFDVEDDSPLVNSGADPALLFKTGDACEVFLGADPAADPARTRPVAGDIRLLFSVMGNNPVCVLFEPVVRQGERQPRLFSSPTGAVPFDRVVALDDARVGVQRRGTGYTLEAAVPLTAIGFSPKPGTVTRGDLGVIFSDPGGSRNVLRVNYANRETAIVNDIPSEARLQPGNWGLMRVE